MVLFAAYATLLHRYSNQEDVVVGTSVANRSQPELETLQQFEIKRGTKMVNFKDVKKRK
jgi:non-ribosomal peptide synthetase component F